MYICIYGEESCFLRWRAVIKDNYNTDLKCLWISSIQSLFDCLLTKDVLGLVFELEKIESDTLNQLNEATRFIRQHRLDVEVAVINASSDETIVSKITQLGYRIKNNQDTVGVKELLKLLDRAIGRRTGGCHTESGERFVQIEMQVKQLLSELSSLKLEVDELNQTLYGGIHTEGIDTRFAICLQQLNTLQAQVQEAERKWVLFEQEIINRIFSKIFSQVLASLWEWVKNNWVAILSFLSVIAATVISFLKLIR